MTTYTKCMFRHEKNGSTAGLVIETEKLNKMSLTEVSRLFPYSESSKMGYFLRSPAQSTWDAAFLYSFESN